MIFSTRWNIRDNFPKEAAEEGKGRGRQICNGMHVTCQFFRDTLNAVTAALTWSFIEGDSREYLRNFRRLFMYSVSLEYMNNYTGRMEWEQRREKALGGLDDLIDKVDLSAWHDLSATRGRAFTFFSLVFPFASPSHESHIPRDHPYLSFPLHTILFATKRLCHVRHVFFSSFLSSLRSEWIFFSKM